MKRLDALPTILKLQQIFKLGYVPSRGGQSYRIAENGIIKNYASIPNCFAHACFNLTNEQLARFNEADFRAFRGFVQSVFHMNNYIAKDLFDFVKECGLKVQRSNGKLPKYSNEWKVALYFGTERFKKDYHFLLLEKDGTWSSKIGCESEIKYFDFPPKELMCNYEYPYQLYGIFKITNPFADRQKLHEGQYDNSKSNHFEVEKNI